MTNLAGDLEPNVRTLMRMLISLDINECYSQIFKHFLGVLVLKTLNFKVEHALTKAILGWVTNSVRHLTPKQKIDNSLNQ